MKFSLFPHQKEAVTFLRTARYGILGDEMGLGKTLSALAATEGNRIIILCPASLKQVWATEIESKFPGRPYHIVKNNSVPELLDRIMILNYERLDPVWLPLFRQAEYVIVDEAHYLKSPKARRTKAFLQLAKACRWNHLYLLTGTPIKNHVPEIWVPLFLCSLSRFETNGTRVTDLFSSQRKFCEALCHVRVKRIHGMMLEEWYGIKDVPLLRSLLDKKFLARKLAQVMDLPPLREVYEEVAKIGRDLELRNAFRKYQEKREAPSPVKVQTAVEKTQFTVPFLRELIKVSDGPVVVFSDHVEPVRVMNEALKAEFSTAFITGETPIKKRSEIIDQFQNGKLDFLIATIGSAGVGVTLTASTHLVFSDMPWVPGDANQARRRIFRIGQAHECTIHYICAPGFDRTIMETLNRKSEVISAALD